MVQLRSGEPIEMPSEFDDFTEKSNRNSNRVTKKAKKNMKQLERAMVAEGFVPLETEWWHYDFKGWEKYPIADVPLSDFK